MTTVREDFEAWLRTECFQKPTPEAYNLAKCAYQAATNRATKKAQEMNAPRVAAAIGG